MPRRRSTTRAGWINSWLLAAASAACPAGGVAGGPETTAEEPFRFGAFRVQIDGLDRPVAVAVGPDGRIFVAESGRGRVSVHAADGTFVLHIAERGRGPADLMRPSGIDVGPDGTVYVADTGNDRIQVFDPEFDHAFSFGTRGTAPARFNQPRGIVVHGDEIFVADSGNDRVQVFALNGDPLRIIGEPGRADGQLHDPVDVAVTADGSIAVTDSGNNRVEIFARDGTFVRAWGDWGPFPGLFDVPAGLVSSGDELLVADRRNHRIQTFDHRGEQQWAWGIHALELREGEGRLHYPDDVAIAPDGSFAVICESFEDRVQVFARATGDEPPGPPVTSATQTHFGSYVDAGGGSFVIGEPEGHFVYLFDTMTQTPTIVSQFGRRGWGHGQFIRITGIALDAVNEEIFVADEARGVIMRLRVKPQEGELRFDPFRIVLVQEFDLSALVGEGRPPRPGAIARTPDGELYVIDQRTSRVLRFDTDLKFIGAFGGDDCRQDVLRRPTDIAVSRDGQFIYVVDADERIVFRFSRNGELIDQFAAAERDPFGIAVAADGAFRISDSRAGVVQFDEGGQTVADWGTRGSDHEQFWRPRGLAFDDEGNLYVVDYGNHRCQVFDPQGRWLMTFGAGRAVTRGDRLGDN